MEKFKRFLCKVFGHRFIKTVTRPEGYIETCLCCGRRRLTNYAGQKLLPWREENKCSSDITS